jgi:hypothetical protein
LVGSVLSYSFFLPRGQAAQEKCCEGSVAGSTLIFPAAQTVQEERASWKLGDVASSELKRPAGQVVQEEEEGVPE